MRCKTLSCGANTYFAGANTADGFVPAYPDWVQEETLERLYIIKGGSGTGKSSLIRHCAHTVERGGGAVTLLLCSSDPASADAAILQGKNGRLAAIVDGTPPHTVEPSLPGAQSEIVDVGRFWNTAILRENRAEIARLAAEKRESFKRAYRFLCAYRSLEEAQHSMLAPCIRQDKLEAAAARLAATISPTAGGEKTVYTFALSMSGAAHLSSLSERAEREYRVIDHAGSGTFFLSAVRRAAFARGCAVMLSPALPDRARVGEMLFGQNGTYLTLAEKRTDDSAVRWINMQRFLDTRQLSLCRARLRFCARCRETMLDGALDALAEAGKRHFALEEIYRSAMDFTGVTETAKRLDADLTEILALT